MNIDIFRRLLHIVFFYLEKIYSWLHFLRCPTAAVLHEPSTRLSQVPSVVCFLSLCQPTVFQEHALGQSRASDTPRADIPPLCRIDFVIVSTTPVISVWFLLIEDLLERAPSRLIICL